MSKVFHHPQTVSTKTHVIDSIEKGLKYQLEWSSPKLGVDHGVDQPLLIQMETPTKIHNLDLL